ncbi:MAG: hypothetical protein ACTS6G_04855, partial [Candidatus Hodgkinia cicadicola]
PAERNVNQWRSFIVSCYLPRQSAVRRMRKLSNDLPIIITTAFAERDKLVLTMSIVGIIYRDEVRNLTILRGTSEGRMELQPRRARRRRKVSNVVRLAQ